MRSEKLYYTDSHLSEFSAVVTSCVEREGGYALTLDRTAFFPEGGGQLADTGYIGDVRVTDVREKDGELRHYVDAPVAPGTAVFCRLDWEQRYRRMQNHSGEHIVSGITHGLYGYENVGFHMGTDCMTIDFSGELTWEQLMDIERRANECVRSDVPIRTYFPDGETLAKLEYRSKLELTHDVRIVEIEGIDRCACCAPHVTRTGEVGIIKILDFMRHRGGVRVSLVCGMDALDDYRARQQSVTEISNATSVKRDQVAEGVRRLLAEQGKQKERIAALSLALARNIAAGYAPTEGNIVVFDTLLDEPALRELVNELAEKCRIAAAFSGGDETGYRYIIGSRVTDLRPLTRAVNAGIGGRGGGKSEMIQGSAGKTAAEIREFMEKLA